MFDGKFEAQKLHFVGFAFLEGVGGQTCVDFECLMHSLKLKFFS